MTFYESIDDFFEELADFSRKRLELLKFARGKTAPTTAKLALQEHRKSAEFYDSFNPYDAYFNEDSCDPAILVFELLEAQKFLQQDVLMDCLAVKFMATPVHNGQLDQSTALLATVNSILKAPELEGIEPSCERSPWKGNREKRMSATVLCYALDMIKEKTLKELSETETEDLGASSEEELDSLLETMNRKNRA